MINTIESALEHIAGYISGETDELGTEVSQRDAYEALDMVRAFVGHANATLNAASHAGTLFPATATTPHTPLTLPEQVLAAGIGEPQPEGAQPVAAVTPGDLGGILRFGVYFDHLGRWSCVASESRPGEGLVGVVSECGNTPEAAFAAVCEQVRQRAHAANLTEARREL